MKSFWDNLKGEAREILRALLENPLVTVVGGLALAVVLWELFWPTQNDIAPDVVRLKVLEAVLSFVVLVLLGGAVSVVYQRRSQRREEKEREAARRDQITDQERELLLTLHEDLVSAFNKARRARLLLRAQLLPGEGDADPSRVPRQAYDEQLATLTDAQLDFDSLRRRVEGNKPLFGEKSNLGNSIRLLESHLRRTVDEYIGSSRLFDGDPPRASLEELPALTRFLRLQAAGQPDPGETERRSKRGLRDEFERAHGFLRREIEKRSPRRPHGKGCILWIDDHPENNEYEKSELRADGHDVVEARSTREALEALRGGQVEPVVIISDMGRNEDGEERPEAGLELIREVRSDPSLPDMNVPVLVYTWSAVVQELGSQVREAGGNITSQPQRLFAFVEAALAPPA